ncbi:hypothetical protein ACKF11_13800 [Methylobacillus sp. Pita2]
MFREAPREPVNKTVLQKIARTAGVYEFYLVATDPDQDGDVIASDIALVLPQVALLRVNLAALDIKSVKIAFKEASLIDVKLAWPGITRRIIDRALGTALSSKGKSLAISRSNSALLGIFSNAPQVYGTAIFEMESLDCGAAFQAAIPVTHANAHDINKLFDLTSGTKLQAREGSCETTRLAPWNYSEAIIECAQELRLPIRDIAQGMHQLFEQQSLTYPRTNSRDLSSWAVEWIEAAANKHGLYDLDFEHVQQVTNDFGIECPRPLSEVDFQTPLRLLGTDQAIMAMLTRNLILCGLPHQVSYPDTTNLPAWAKHLPWQRIKTRRLPWIQRRPEPGLNILAPDVAILKIIAEHKLGRPIAQVRLAEKFIARQLTNSYLSLTSKGREWIRLTPPQLLDLPSFKQFELELTKQTTMPPAMRAAWLIERLGHEISTRVQSHLEQTQPTSNGSHHLA